MRIARKSLSPKRTAFNKRGLSAKKIEENPAVGEFPVVAIGASAGGLEALSLFVENLTPDLGMAYVVVEHLDPDHKSMLAELLGRKTSVPIEEVKHRTKVNPDRIYVIPPNRNLALEKGELLLTSRLKGPGEAHAYRLSFPQRGAGPAGQLHRHHFVGDGE